MGSWLQMDLHCFTACGKVVTSAGRASADPTLTFTQPALGPKTGVYVGAASERVEDAATVVTLLTETVVAGATVSVMVTWVIA